MILITHGSVGAVVAGSLSFNPVIALIASFLSHFLLDAIPHWDYNLSSLEKNGDVLEKKIEKTKDIKKDILKVFVDGSVGVLIPILVAVYFDFNVWIFAFGAVLGILPDFLQAVYYKFKPRIMIPFIKFHHYIHSKKHIKNFYFGFGLQLLIIFVVYFTFIKFY